MSDSKPDEIKIPSKIIGTIGYALCDSMRSGHLQKASQVVSADMLCFMGMMAIKVLSYEKYAPWAHDMLGLVAEHPNLPYEKLQEFLNTPPCNNAFYGALRNPQLSAGELNEWAKKPITLTDDGCGSPTCWALQAICENPNTSCKTLQYITARTDFVTAVAIAHKENSWPDHLQSLCEALRDNPKTPSDAQFFIDCMYANPYGYDEISFSVPANVKNPLL